MIAIFELAVVKCDHFDCYRQLVLDTTHLSKGRVTEVLTEMKWSVDRMTDRATCPDHTCELVAP